MSTSSLRPNLPQTLPIEEASGSSTNEQTPLLSSHQTQSDHRLLGLFIPPWLPRRYIVVLVGFISMMMVVLVSVLFLDPIWRREQLVFMNNGTHDFRKTVIVISFDGFRYVLSCRERECSHLVRADYLERGLTPHLVATGDSGLRARWMQPSYPVRNTPCCFPVDNLFDLGSDFSVRKFPGMWFVLLMHLDAATIGRSCEHSE